MPAAKKSRPRSPNVIESASLAKLSWLIHGFSTRATGNLAFPKNRAAFEKSIGATNWPMATLKQVHSDVIYRVGSAEDCAKTLHR